MYPEKIDLYNRDNIDVHLQQINENIYELKIEEPFDEYLRCGLSDIEGEYIFVDPSGGPFISIDNKIYDKHTCVEFLVTKIYRFKSNARFAIMIELKNMDI